MSLYFPILLFILLTMVLGVVALSLGRVISPNLPHQAKLESYECGFPTVGTARLPFDLRYYRVAILFILFDLETAFLIPWALSLRHLGQPALLTMLIFLTVLCVGFIYEWRKGALAWT